MINHGNYIIIILWLTLISCGHESGRKDSSLPPSKMYTKKQVERDIPKRAALPQFNSQSIIPMKKSSDVYEIPVIVNGVNMDFIFDTGAGMISISALEATFLYKQRKLNTSDFIGTSNFMDANGNISEGVVINLKTVQLGNRILHNVKASVVDNMTAPLLFGQSALSRFGKVTIDYSRNVLIIE